MIRRWLAPIMVAASTKAASRSESTADRTIRAG